MKEKLHFGSDMSFDEQQEVLESMQDLSQATNGNRGGFLDNIKKRYLVLPAMVLLGIGAATSDFDIESNLSSDSAQFAQIHDSYIRTGSYCPHSRSECVKDAKKYYNALPSGMDAYEKFEDARLRHIRQHRTYELAKQHGYVGEITDETRMDVYLEVTHNEAVKIGSQCSDHEKCKRISREFHDSQDDDVLPIDREIMTVNESVMRHIMNNPKLGLLPDSSVKNELDK